jgi:hypothetical protein
MTGTVLALAGLTCGDGGPGMGASREPVKVAVKLGDGFSGYIRLPGGPLCKAKQHRDALCLDFPGGQVCVFNCALAPWGEGQFRLRHRGCVYRGTVSAGSRGIILTLDPTPQKDEPDSPGGDLAETIRNCSTLER